MKNRSIFILTFTILAGIFFYSCVKKPKYSSIPVIKYQDFLRYGKYSDPDSVEVAVAFEDEEGDIGFEASEATGIIKNGNLFLVYYYDSLNVPPPYNWCAWDSSSNPMPPFDTLKIQYRVPPVLAQNEASQPMKGVIYVKLKKPSIRLPIHNPIKYKIYMYDKAMHKSNIVDSGPISF